MILDPDRIPVRIRIQDSQINADPDPQPWFELFFMIALLNVLNFCLIICMYFSGQCEADVLGLQLFLQESSGQN
jgi:hypothetical protein